MCEKKQRPGFMLYFEDCNMWLDALGDDNPEFGLLLGAIIRYAFDKAEPQNLSRQTMAYFKQMRPKIDRDTEKYHEKIEQCSKAGKNKGKRKHAVNDDQPSFNENKRTINESQRSIIDRYQSVTSSGTKTETTTATNPHLHQKTDHQPQQQTLSFNDTTMYRDSSDLVHDAILLGCPREKAGIWYAQRIYYSSTKGHIRRLIAETHDLSKVYDAIKKEKS